MKPTPPHFSSEVKLPVTPAKTLLDAKVNLARKVILPEVNRELIGEKKVTICFLIEKPESPKDCENAYSYGSVRKWDCSKVIN